jgi:hypothetical protein
MFSDLTGSGSAVSQPILTEVLRKGRAQQETRPCLFFMMDFARREN